MPEADDDTTPFGTSDETAPLDPVGDALLREAERLRSGGPVDPTAAGADSTTADGEVRRPLTGTGFADPPLTAEPDRGHRLRDPGALLVGGWFTVAGVAAALLGESTLEHLPAVLVPTSFAVVGLGLLLPKRPGR